MSAKGSCIFSDKVTVNLITTVKLLRSCYGQDETIKLFAKSILITITNICYHNVELKVLPIKKTDKKQRLKIELDI